MNNFHRGKKDVFFFWKEHAFGSVALKNGGEEDEAEDEVRQINRESQ